MQRKSLIKNSMFSICYNLMTVLFPLISVSYAARVLLADGIGRVAFANNITQYFIVFASLGIPSYGIREIAKSTNNPNRTNKLFSELFCINAISTMCCIILYYGMILSYNFFSEDQSLYLVVGLSLIFNFFNVDWFYQGKEEYRYITIRSLIIKCLSLLLLILFVKNKSDYINYAIISNLAIFGNNIFNMIHLRKYVRFTFKNLEIIRHIKPVFILLFSVVSVQVYTQVNTTMLGIMGTNKEVGYYSNSVKLVRMLTTLTAAINVVLLPRLSYYHQNRDFLNFNKIIEHALKILILISIPCALGIILIAKPLIVTLFGHSFEPAILTIKILSPLIIILSIGNLFGVQILMSVGEEKKILISTIFGAVLNILLSFFLIRLFSHNGAAVASVLSECLVAIIQIAYAKKYIKIHISLRYVISTLTACICMMLIVIMTNNFLYDEASNLTQLLLLIVCGVLSYFFILIISKNEIVKELKKIIM